MTRSEALDKAAQTPAQRQLLARVWDKLEQARRGAPACTPFLSTAEQEAVIRLIAAAGGPRHLWAGGYPDAERKVCAFLPDWQDPEDWEPPYVALRCIWRSGETLTHRDFLGAILGQGLDREKVGDILVGEGRCDLLVFRELTGYLLQNFTGAGRAKLQASLIPLEEVQTPEKQVRVIHDTVSTPRLDAVMASGFAMGRSKAAELISSGRVELNHVPCVKTDRTVAQGDTITCRGFGKCVVTALGGLSKKGRTIVTLERYL